MRNRMIIIFLTVLICASVAKVMAKDNLRLLDDIIENRSAYASEKVKAIREIRNNYKTATTDSDRYNVLRQLYKEYRTYRIDSAIIVADERLRIARRLGSLSKIASATLNLAESYVKSGVADKALLILDTLKREPLEDYHRKYLNSVYKNAWLLKSETEMIPAERMKALEKVREYRETSLKETPHDSRAFYTIQAEKFMDSGMYREAVSKMEEADKLFDFSDDAAMQYTMGRIYLAAGEREKAIDCLSKAAAIDISSGVKEYQSLILLASLLFEEGDVERAFVYINCALEDTHFSNANLRNPQIMESMPVIDQAFHAYEKQNKRKNHTFLLIAGILVVLLVITLFLLLKTLRANKKMLTTIEKINNRLRERNHQLEQADVIKLQSINALIMSNARYISRLKAYRKTVYRLMKTGQYDKAMEALKSDRNDSKDVNAFHELFDESFLSIFPDFISKVNKILTQPVELKEGNRLTPELRVMALMRLGLSSTEEIAGVLHYTPQSVYNLRSTIRSMSSLPREEFEEALKQL